METWDLYLRLSKALHAGDIDEVESSLSAGLDPNYRQDAEPPMIVATKAAFLPGLDAIHRAGGNIDIANYSGFTPLMIAAAHGYEQTASWLLNHGADLNARNNDGETPLAIALRYKETDFVEMVLKMDSRHRETHLVTAAGMVMGQRNVRVAEWLLKQGISPNLKDESGNLWITLLQTGHSKESQLITETLLNAGADVNLVDATGGTPLHQAFYMNIEPSFMKLLQAGADPDFPDRNGNSVRKLVEALSPTSNLRRFFAAWDSSCKAQRMIEEVLEGPGARPL